MIFKYSPRSLDPTGNRKIPLGKQGENKRMTLEFDVREWMDEYPKAELAVYVKPPEGEAYLAGIDKEQNGVYRWEITNSDTVSAGEGMIELVMRDEETGAVNKSITAKTMIMPSISAEAPGEIPEAHVPWWERALALIEIGVSPEVVVTEIEGGHRIEITDEKGLHAFDVMDGKDGKDGAPGKDGKDGAPGADGKDYVLTEADKQEIARMIEVPEGGGGLQNLVDGQRDYSLRMLGASEDLGISSIALNEAEASGQCSFASGGGTASGNRSHAVNTGTARGYESYAEGWITIAGSDYQHVQGKRNIEDAENRYAHIVGNGDLQKKSNAHTLDWDGNGWFAGDVYVGGTSQDDGEKLVKESAIPTVINDALAQAKASGEFDGADGKDGKDGDKGDPGAPGDDGFSPTVTLTRQDDGVRIDVQNKNGMQTATVYDGKNAENNALLEGGTPNQMLVTDADGKVAWEGRLDRKEDKVIFPQSEGIFVEDMFVYTTPLEGEIVVGETYTLNFNGVDYECPAFELPINEETGEVAPAVGNPIVFGGDDNGAPILLVVVPPEQFEGMGEVTMIGIPIPMYMTELTAVVSITALGMRKIEPKYLPMDAIAEAVIAKIPSATGVSF